MNLESSCRTQLLTTSDVCMVSVILVKIIYQSECKSVMDLFQFLMHSAMRSIMPNNRFLL